MRRLPQDAVVPAPECLEGEYDEKIDIWGLGIVVYQLVTGRKPFDAFFKDELR